MNTEYIIVVRDGEGWGVEWNGALINDYPMSKAKAKELAKKFSNPDYRFVDDNPLWECDLGE